MGVARYSTEHEKSRPETDLSDAEWTYIESHFHTKDLGWTAEIMRHLPKIAPVKKVMRAWARGER